MLIIGQFWWILVKFWILRRLWSLIFQRSRPSGFDLESDNLTILSSFVVIQWVPSHFFLNKHVERHSVVMDHLSLCLRGVTSLAASSRKNRETAESTKIRLKSIVFKEDVWSGNKILNDRDQQSLVRVEKQYSGLYLKPDIHCTIFRDLVNTNTHCTSKSSPMYCYYVELCTHTAWPWTRPESSHCTSENHVEMTRGLSCLLTTASRDWF